MNRELSEEEKRRLDSLRAALGSSLDSRSKFELLLFWAWHPSGWSSQGALAPRSPLRRSELNEALVRLTEAGVGGGVRLAAIGVDPEAISRLDLAACEPSLPEPGRPRHVQGQIEVAVEEAVVQRRRLHEMMPEAEQLHDTERKAADHRHDPDASWRPARQLPLMRE